jgi:hypothetical protein
MGIITIPSLLSYPPAFFNTYHIPRELATHIEEGKYTVYM